MFKVQPHAKEALEKIGNFIAFIAFMTLMLMLLCIAEPEPQWNYEQAKTIFGSKY